MDNKISVLLKLGLPVAAHTMALELGDNTTARNIERDLLSKHGIIQKNADGVIVNIG